MVEHIEKTASPTTPESPRRSHGQIGVSIDEGDDEPLQEVAVRQLNTIETVATMDAETSFDGRPDITCTADQTGDMSEESESDEN